MDMDLIKKISGGLIIATITWCGHWVYNMGSRTSVLEVHFNNVAKLIVDNQSRLTMVETKVVGVEKEVMGVFKDLTALQEKQVLILNKQTEQMNDFRKSLDDLREDINTLHKDNK